MVSKSNVLMEQEIQRFLRKVKKTHPLGLMLSQDYWETFADWFRQNRKLGRVPTRRWPESKLLDNFMSEHFRMFGLTAMFEAEGKRWEIEMPKTIAGTDDVPSNVVVGSTIIHDLLAQDTKYLKASQEKVVEFMETEGIMPRRFHQNLKVPFDQFFIEFDKPWIFPNWITAGGINKEPMPVHIWGVLSQFIEHRFHHTWLNPTGSGKVLASLPESDQGPWVKLIILYGHNPSDGTGAEIRLINNLDYTPRSLWNDEDEDYWARTLEIEDIEHSDNLFRCLFPTVTDSDFMVLSLFDGSIYVDSSNYESTYGTAPIPTLDPTGEGVPPAVKIGTIYELDNLRLDRKWMAMYAKYQEGVRSWGEFARIFSTTLLYMMSKSIRFTNSRPLTRAERRRGDKYPSERSRGAFPAPWLEVEVEVLEDDERKIATGAGTPHSFRYDVIGHTRIYRKKQADGSIRRVPVWVKGHQRGIRHEDYVPKRHTFTTEHTVSSEIKQLVIEQV